MRTLLRRMAGAAATYEVNQWLWQFGRGKPRLGGLTIEETAKRQVAAPAKHQTSVGRRLVRVAKAIVPDWNEVCVWSVYVCTCTSQVHTSMYWYVLSVAERWREDTLVTLACGK